MILCMLKSMLFSDSPYSLLCIICTRCEIVDFHLTSFSELDRLLFVFFCVFNNTSVK